MIITMIAMWMVQSTIDQIVDMVAMWNRFVAATRAMHVGVIMTVMVFDRVAPIGIRGTKFDNMLINMIGMRIVKVTIMEIVNVVAVLDSGVTTINAMLVIVVFVMRQIAVSHRVLRFTQRGPRSKRNVF